ncbi:MAG: bifunctional metallophosphatase/5'-nucleotidase, partial [Pyrinomonadaceae bacterium]
MTVKHFTFRSGRKISALFFLLLFFSSFIQITGQQRVWIKILSTTDLHGHISPTDYYTNKPDSLGLACVAEIIKNERTANPDALLVDSGDTIQGTPLVYYHNIKNNAPVDPMMLVMNALKYDSMAVGNHEYNFGLKVLGKARREAAFPWLSANTYQAGTDQTFYQPYLIKEVRGVRVGLLGLSTPGIPTWENKENYRGLEFRDPLPEAKKWVARLREEEKVDLVVITMHMGLEADLATGEKTPGQVENENAAIAIAKEVPGIDLILMGHTHREIPSLTINGVLIAQAAMWGRRIVSADIYLDRDAMSKKWRVVAKQSRTIPVDNKVKPDAEILKLVEPYEAETQKWLSKSIGVSAKDLSAKDGRFEDTALLDLINRVQLEAGKAQVSMAANFNPGAAIKKGNITVRDISALYVYENTLVVIEVTGAQLKAALEHSAKYFRVFEPGKTPPDLVDPKIPGYNFDVAEG